MKQVQWFPGHMKKTLIEIQKNLKLVDIVLELRDARAPLSSENPKISDLIQGKKRVIILTKRDLADEIYAKQWLQYFADRNQEVILFDVHHDNVQKIVQKSEEVLKEKFARDAQRGMKKRPIKAMIVGIPNVGKSTLINRISAKKATIVGNKPGVTKTKQWIRIHKNMELLDTPGVLWPKFDNERYGIHLAVIGTIKDTILPIDEIVFYAMDFLKKYYPNALNKRYNIKEMNDFEKLDNTTLLTKIAQDRGMLHEEEDGDIFPIMMIFLNELREGKLGRLTFDRLEFETDES